MWVLSVLISLTTLWVSPAIRALLLRVIIISGLLLATVLSVYMNKGREFEQTRMY